jgi:hypothetical protein
MKQLSRWLPIRSFFCQSAGGDTGGDGFFYGGDAIGREKFHQYNPYCNRYGFIFYFCHMN